MSRSITQQMRKSVREALEHVLSDEDFWLVFDAVIEAEVAKASCSLNFSTGEAYIYIGEGDAPERVWRIDEIKRWADYDDLVPRSDGQAEEAREELAAIDAFMTRLTELRTKIADSIARAKP